MFPVFIAMALKLEISHFVQVQLSDYNYTFPGEPKVSAIYPNVPVLHQVSVLDMAHL